MNAAEELVRSSSRKLHAGRASSIGILSLSWGKEYWLIILPQLFVPLLSRFFIVVMKIFWCYSCTFMFHAVLRRCTWKPPILIPRSIAVSVRFITFSATSLFPFPLGLCLLIHPPTTVMLPCKIVPSKCFHPSFRYEDFAEGMWYRSTSTWYPLVRQGTYRLPIHASTQSMWSCLVCSCATQQVCARLVETLGVDESALMIQIQSPLGLNSC